MTLARRVRRCCVSVSAKARLLARVVDLHRLGSDLDVCIVGSGPAGAILGLDLVQRGWTVLIVESGPTRRRWFARQFDDYRSSGKVDYPFAASQYRGFGGTSRLWYGACPRLRPIDFERNAYTPPTASWPVAHSELKPYYERAEQTLGVRSGLSTGVPGSFLEQAGITLERPAIARRPEGGGSFRVARDLLPGFCAESRRAFLGVGHAIGLTHDSDGRVSGVTVRGRGSALTTVQARIYVVACGGLETPRLLLASRSQRFPDGIGNDSGVVGRCFMEHLHVRFQGTLRQARFTGGRCFQFYEAFKRCGLGSPIISIQPQRPECPAALTISADVEMYPSEENRIALAQRRDRLGRRGADLSLSLAPRDRETTCEVDRVIRGIFARLGAKAIESVPGHHGAIFWLFHHMGTCRMGNDPASSVADRNLRVHCSQNLYLAGSASFVTAGASNPTLTIAALSHRLADHLHQRLGAAP